MEELLVIVMLIYMITFILEIYYLFNNKGVYLKTSYKALERICKTSVQKNLTISLKEINRFYEEYVQEDAQTKKYFPNVVVWLDAIIFRIDCGYKHATVLKEYENEIKQIRDELETKNPFNKCEKYQQDILQDISKISTSENEIIIQNIIKRTEEEFIRLSADIKKNDRLNKVSLTVGVVGIVISIIMAFMKL